MSKQSISLDDYVLAGYPAIYLRTTDEQRALRECLRVQKILSDKNDTAYKKPKIIPKKGIENPNYRKDIPSSEELLEEYENGMTIPKLAKKYNCGTTTIHRRLKQIE